MPTCHADKGWDIHYPSWSWCITQVKVKDQLVHTQGRVLCSFLDIALHCIVWNAFYPSPRPFFLNNVKKTAIVEKRGIPYHDNLCAGLEWVFPSTLCNSSSSRIWWRGASAGDEIGKTKFLLSHGGGNHFNDDDDDDDTWEFFSCWFWRRKVSFSRRSPSRS